MGMPMFGLTLVPFGRSWDPVSLVIDHLPLSDIT